MFYWSVTSTVTPSYVGSEVPNYRGDPMPDDDSKPSPKPADDADYLDRPVSLPPRTPAEKAARAELGAQIYEDARAKIAIDPKTATFRDALVNPSLLDAYPDIAAKLMPFVKSSSGLSITASEVGRKLAAAFPDSGKQQRLIEMFNQHTSNGIGVKTSDLMKSAAMKHLPEYDPERTLEDEDFVSVAPWNPAVGSERHLQALRKHTERIAEDTARDNTVRDEREERQLELLGQVLDALVSSQKHGKRWQVATLCIGVVTGLGGVFLGPYVHDIVRWLGHVL
jgi:hypothetical protein